MAIWYINENHTVSYADDIQPFIDNGYLTPNINNNDTKKPKHIYNIIDPDIFHEILGSSYKLFYVKPNNLWSKTKKPPFFQNDIVRFENNIYIDQINKVQCDDMQTIVDNDISENDVSQIIINNQSNIFIPNYIYVIKTC